MSRVRTNAAEAKAETGATVDAQRKTHLTRVMGGNTTAKLARLNRRRKMKTLESLEIQQA